MHGFGFYANPSDNETYLGGWSKDKRHGRGLLILPGSKTAVEYDQGKPISNIDGLQCFERLLLLIYFNGREGRLAT
jgi:hypothetical protein